MHASAKIIALSYNANNNYNSEKYELFMFKKILLCKSNYNECPASKVARQYYGVPGAIIFYILPIVTDIT